MRTPPKLTRIAKKQHTQDSKDTDMQDAVAATASEEEEDDIEDRGLLSLRRIRLTKDRHGMHKDWLRPYWLGAGLFLVLFAFWILDSLKDPILSALVGGNLDYHQPPAKLFSVCMTLCLVCFLEYISNERRREKERSKEEILDAGGHWNRMQFASDNAAMRHSSSSWDEPHSTEHGVSGNIFISVGVPYAIGFGIMAYLLQFNQSVALTDPSHVEPTKRPAFWTVLGYFMYGSIESFGSIAVATFWSYTNSTLSLDEAERFYGLVVSIAQLGAIAGSTMVTLHVWSNITLVVVACLVIVLHIPVMVTYSRRFPPTSDVRTKEDSVAEEELSPNQPTLWSGVYLILKYNYVLLILGASCLYEVSLTCLNYQMTLLGWKRFEETPHEGMSFTQFMGHYGQMVNISSLIFSSIVFPFLLRRFGLRWTLRLFPTLLLIANVLAFGVLRGNLALLFFSMSTLKALTYSVHDPSKEILYLPTSSAIKFKSKFWIDVVGARIAKAIGSSINSIAGSVDRSIRVASAPSLLTAIFLWYVCYRVGTLFDRLIASDTVVGVDDDVDVSNITRMSADDYEKLVDDSGLEVDAADDSVFDDPTSASLELSPLRRH